jgi:hypothetical protein
LPRPKSGFLPAASIFKWCLKSGQGCSPHKSRWQESSGARCIVAAPARTLRLFNEGDAIYCIVLWPLLSQVLCGDFWRLWNFDLLGARTWNILHLKIFYKKIYKKKAFKEQSKCLETDSPIGTDSYQAASPASSAPRPAEWLRWTGRGWKSMATPRSGKSREGILLPQARQLWPVRGCEMEWKLFEPPMHLPKSNAHVWSRSSALGALNIITLIVGYPCPDTYVLTLVKASLHIKVVLEASIMTWLR